MPLLVECSALIIPDFGECCTDLHECLAATLDNCFAPTEIIPFDRIQVISDDDSVAAGGLAPSCGIDFLVMVFVLGFYFFRATR